MPERYKRATTHVFPIRVPALRDRLEDIPVFMNHFLRKFCRMHDRKAAGFTGRAIDNMLSYHWPGNIRELENVVERGVILAPDGGAIDSVHLFAGGEQVESSHLSVGAGGCCGGRRRLPRQTARPGRNALRSRPKSTRTV